MLDIHEWSKVPYETPKRLTNHPVLVPRYWFGEGIGQEIKKQDIIVLGVVKASHYTPGKNFAPAHEIEYGVTFYQGQALKLAAPLPGVTEEWTCYGGPPSLY